MAPPKWPSNLIFLSYLLDNLGKLFFYSYSTSSSKSSKLVFLEVLGFYLKNSSSLSELLSFVFVISFLSNILVVLDFNLINLSEFNLFYYNSL